MKKFLLALLLGCLLIPSASLVGMEPTQKKVKVGSSLGETLNDDCLVEILAFIGPEKSGSIPPVSKKFHAAMYKALSSYHPNISSPEECAFIDEYCVCFPCNPQTFDECLYDECEDCEYCRFNGCTHHEVICWSDERIESFCKWLKKRDDTTVKPFNIVNEHNGPHTPEKVIKTILTLKNIKKISICFIHGDMISDLNNLLPETKSKMTSLSLQSYSISTNEVDETEDDCSFFSKLSNLETLSMGMNIVVRNKFLRQLPAPEKLIVLDLTSCELKSNDPPVLSIFSNLQTLCLPYKNYTSDLGPKISLATIPKTIEIISFFVHEIIGLRPNNLVPESQTHAKAENPHCYYVRTEKKHSKEKCVVLVRPLIDYATLVASLPGIKTVTLRRCFSFLLESFINKCKEKNIVIITINKPTINR